MQKRKTEDITTIEYNSFEEFGIVRGQRLGSADSLSQEGADLVTSGSDPMRRVVLNTTMGAPPSIGKISRHD